MNVLEVSGLRKTYPGFLLDDVCFAAKEGRITGFIGRNGAGKSTTLKAMLGMVHADGGSVRFFGKEFESCPRQIKEQIGFVSGGVDFYPHKKLSAITAVTRRFYPAWDDAAYRRLMEKFALDEKKTPAQLSSGMKVKYALVLALSHRARLLILDEPTSGLDPVSREELLEIFLELKDDGVSILFSTHITSDLDKCADDIVYIRGGQVQAYGELGGFVSRYRVVSLREKADDSRYMGVRRVKDGYRALIDAKDAAALACDARPADLESIMVHLEKEEQA
ncbi:MAG: ABC transporter ATP-binding protein [Christensenellaceae bacterium]|nr:ABC transporter ATP-binding protein [Christensenellaceae bacterium]